MLWCLDLCNFEQMHTCHVLTTAIVLLTYLTESEWINMYLLIIEYLPCNAIERKVKYYNIVTIYFLIHVVKSTKIVKYLASNIYKYKRIMWLHIIIYHVLLMYVVIVNMLSYILLSHFITAIFPCVISYKIIYLACSLVHLL